MVEAELCRLVKALDAAPSCVVTTALELEMAAKSAIC